MRVVSRWGEVCTKDYEGRMMGIRFDPRYVMNDSRQRMNACFFDRGCLMTKDPDLTQDPILKLYQVPDIIPHDLTTFQEDLASYRYIHSLTTHDLTIIPGS